MRQHSIRSVRLPSGTSFETVRALGEEFPTVSFERGGALVRGDAAIDLAAWSRASSFQPFDDAVDRSITSRLVLQGDASDVLVANEIITRYQRWLDRRTPASKSRVFDGVLAAHRKLHDVEKPLVRADLEHALDTWQWLLRLAPDASLALQLAALFHDIERLESEAERRLEHRVRDYREFKERHAQRGSDIAFDVLLSAGVEESVAARARDLIACHERRMDDREIALLNDADGLSFFSLKSAGYFDDFGPLQTRRKIGYTLARLGRNARFQMSTLRLRPDVEELFAAVVRA